MCSFSSQKQAKQFSLCNMLLSEPPLVHGFTCLHHLAHRFLPFKVSEKHIYCKSFKYLLQRRQTPNVHILMIPARLPVMFICVILYTFLTKTFVSSIRRTLLINASSPKAAQVLCLKLWKCKSYPHPRQLGYLCQSKCCKYRTVNLFRWDGSTWNSWSKLKNSVWDFPKGWKWWIFKPTMCFVKIPSTRIVTPDFRVGEFNLWIGLCLMFNSR